MPDSMPMATVVALCKALIACKIEFVIVGGVAVSLVGRPRYTADVDAVLWDADQRLPEILDCLAESEFRPRAQNCMEVARRSRVLLLEDSNAIGVDLSLGALPFERWMIDEAKGVETDMVTVPVASPEALVVMKAIAWRPKDIEDIRELTASNPGLNRERVFEYSEEFFELLGVAERLALLKDILSAPY